MKCKEKITYSLKMAYQLPRSSKKEYIIAGISGRRPTEQGFQYLIDWKVRDGIETTAEYAYFLEHDDPEVWLPRLEAFDQLYPDPDAVIGDFSWWDEQLEN